MSQSSNDFLAPYAPTIGTATNVGTNRPFGNGAVSVTFTPEGPNAATSFTVTASTGQTATGASSPIIVTGFASGATATFTVTGTNAAGTGAASAASNSVTVTTVPDAPSAASATAGVNANTVQWTAPNNGGSAITNYYVAGNDGTSGNTSSTSTSINDAANTSQYYNVYADNANGRSAASNNTNTVTTQAPFFPPFFPPGFFAPPRFGCINEDTLILTSEGYKMAKDIKIGDMLISLSFDKLPNEGEYDPATWEDTHLGNAKVIESKIFSIQATLQNETFMINNDDTARFSLQEEILALRGNTYKFVTPAGIQIGDQIVYRSDEEIKYLAVESVDTVDVSSIVYRFFTDPDVLVLGQSFIIRN